MKRHVYIDRDGRWPDYVLSLPREDGRYSSGFLVEVDSELVERWNKALTEYEAVQDLLDDIYEAGRIKALT
jgi:hypothetical protein